MANNDLFFEPWEGKEYKKGIKLENGKIKLCEKENEGIKVMVLGLEHYCTDCDTYKKNGHCTQLPDCKSKTQKVVGEFLNGTNYKSLITFTDIFEYGNRNIWKYFLFSNFFQIGMPNESASQNKKYRKETNIDKKEKIKAVNAFAEIVKKNVPDIIIVWGKEDKDIGSSILNLLDDKDLEFLTNRKIPRIDIDNEESANYVIPFTILKNKTKNKDSLVIFLDHPASASFTHTKKIYAQKNHRNILCFLGNIQTIMNWDLNKVKAVNNTKKRKHFTCKFDKNLNWVNSQDFPFK